MSTECDLWCTSGCHNDECEHHGWEAVAPADPEGLREAAQAYLDAFDLSSTNGSREAWDARWTALDALRAALRELTP